MAIGSLVWLGFCARGLRLPDRGDPERRRWRWSIRATRSRWRSSAFFALPLLFTLFFGRTFCAAVCPLGAVQELVAVRPVRVPRWLEHALGLLPYVYLGAGVVLARPPARRFSSAATIRSSASSASAARVNMLVVGGCLLVIGVFVGRPYCRYLVPLRRDPRARVEGVEVARPDSARRVHPLPAVRGRLSLRGDRRADRGPAAARRGRRRGGGSALLLVLLPVLVVGGGLLGTATGRAAVAAASRPSRWPSGSGPKRRGLVEGTTDASDAFRNTGRPLEDLYAAAIAQRQQARAGRRWPSARGSGWSSA